MALLSDRLQGEIDMDAAGNVSGDIQGDDDTHAVRVTSSGQLIDLSLGVTQAIGNGFVGGATQGEDRNSLPTVEEPVTGAAVADVVPPTSQVSVRRFVGADGRLRARVAVVASDVGGAGLADVRWETTSGESGTYDAPFTVAAVGDVLVYARDRAGNVQAKPATAALDDRTGLPFAVSTFAPDRFGGAGTIASGDDIDYWGILASRAGRLVATSTPGVRVSIDDADGNELASATGPLGAVSVSVPPGKYLVRVTAQARLLHDPQPYAVVAALRRQHYYASIKGTSGLAEAAAPASPSHRR